MINIVNAIISIFVLLYIRNTLLYVLMFFIYFLFGCLINIYLVRLATA